MIKIAVLVSGSGSNLQALIDANLSGKIAGVISNKPDAFALQRAQKQVLQLLLLNTNNTQTEKHLMMLCINNSLIGILI